MTEEPTEQEIDEYILHLIEQGAMELVGINEEGEPIYKFTEQCKELAPELYEIAEQDFGERVMVLWQAGMVDLMWPEDNGDPVLALLPKAFDEDEVAALDEFTREALYEIIRTFDEYLELLDDESNDNV